MNAWLIEKMADGDEDADKQDDMKMPNHDNLEMEVENADEIQELNDIVEHCSQEYLSLNNTLDQLDSCLDTLEQRNNGLYAQLKDLLDSTRNARHELQMLSSGTALPSDEPENWWEILVNDEFGVIFNIPD